MSNKQISKIKYELKHGSRYTVPAEAIQGQLEKVYETNGVLTAELVVDSARPEKSKLHPIFEWRDDVAAEGYRKSQARNLIRCVQVVYPDGQNIESSPQWVNLPDTSVTDDGRKTEAGYHPTETVIKSPDMYILALSELTAKFHAAERSLDALRRAAENSPQTDSDRLSRISIAVQAMQTASAAVAALH